MSTLFQCSTTGEGARVMQVQGRVLLDLVLAAWEAAAGRGPAPLNSILAAAALHVRHPGQLFSE